MIGAKIKARLRAAVLHVGAAIVLPACLGMTAAQADPIWGANGHPFSAYPGVSLDQQLGYMHDLGLKSYRVNISDLKSAPALAELVAKGKPLGIEILPVITPPLDLKTLPTEELRKKAYDLAFGLVSQFKGKIPVWELGNEMENHAIIQPCEMQDDGKQYNCAWGPAGGVGPLEYYGPRWQKVSAVLKGLSEGAIAADPTVRKAMGTAGWGHLGAFDRMKQDGIQWDLSAWHMYGEDPEWAFKALSAHGKPIWVTEMNHPLGSQKSEQEQADGLTKWMARLRELSAQYKVEAVHLYELMDETYWAPDFEAVMGLVRLDKAPNGGWQPGAPKRAYDGVKRFVRGGDTPSPVVSRQCQLDQPATGAPLTQRQLEYSYCMMLGRQASESDLRVWGARQREGIALKTLWETLGASPEFAKNYRTPYLTDEEFVTLTFRLMLGREPDGQGLADYSSQLREGKLARAALIGALAGSDEFKTRHPLLFQPA
jgi:hypothetical protein